MSVVSKDNRYYRLANLTYAGYSHITLITLILVESLIYFSNQVFVTKLENDYIIRFPFINRRSNLIKYLKFYH